MCNRAVRWHNLCLLQYVSDWFEGVIQEKIKIWPTTGSFYDDRLTEWHEGCKRRKAEKAKIKEELLPITWHPDCAMGLCMSGDEKKRNRKIVFDH